MLECLICTLIVFDITYHSRSTGKLRDQLNGTEHSGSLLGMGIKQAIIRSNKGYYEGRREGGKEERKQGGKRGRKEARKEGIKEANLLALD